MRILIGHDGSPGADAALQDLERAGLPDAGEATVLAVADAWLPPEMPAEADGGAVTFAPIAEAVDRRRKRADELRAQAQALAESAAAALRRALPRWDVRAETAIGSPGWELIRRSDVERHDLVVLGSAGRGALGRLAFGSVSRQVLTHAHVSVRVGRHHAHATSAIRIVAGLDGSAGSQAAVDALAKREWPKGTQVRLVTALDDVLLPAIDPMALPAVGAMLADETKWAQELGERAAEPLRARGLDVQPVVRPGDPRRTLLDEAAHWSADAIVLGARGVRGFDRVLLGSVSSSVAERAHCTVEVVRPAE